MILNSVYTGDCKEIMKKFPCSSIDLTVTSPPYDNLRKYKGYKFDFKSIARQLYRITKEGGVVVWVVADATINGSETGTSFKQALYFKEIGFNLHDTMIYEKKNYVPLTHNRYEQCFEYMFVFSKNKPKTFNPIMVPCKSVGVLVNHATEKSYEKSYSMKRRKCSIAIKAKKIHPNKFIYVVGAGYRTEHNAPFPEELAIDHILSWSNKNDIILDPMCGSGTTLAAAKDNGRQFIGIDTSADYAELSKIRCGLKPQVYTGGLWDKISQ